jgi:anti-sigma regulatory factor (Ser/Thr protein kinase)
MQKIKIEMPSEFTFVRGVRVCIAHIAHSFGFSDRETYQIETIVDEVCNNAIEHGSKKDRDNDVIKVLCNFEMGRLELMVTDKGGEGFDLTEVLRRNKRLIETGTIEANLDKRGRGLIIVQRFVDELSVITGKDGTTVKAIKKAKEN